MSEVIFSEWIGGVKWLLCKFGEVTISIPGNGGFTCLGVDGKDISSRLPLETIAFAKEWRDKHWDRLRPLEENETRKIEQPSMVGKMRIIKDATGLVVMGVAIDYPDRRTTHLTLEDLRNCESERPERLAFFLKHHKLEEDKKKNEANAKRAKELRAIICESMRDYPHAEPHPETVEMFARGLEAMISLSNSRPEDCKDEPWLAQGQDYHYQHAYLHTHTARYRGNPTSDLGHPESIHAAVRLLMATYREGKL